MIANLTAIATGLPQTQTQTRPLTDAQLQELANQGVSPSTLRELQAAQEGIQSDFGPNFITPQLAREVLDELGEQETEEDVRPVAIAVYFEDGSIYYYSERRLGPGPFHYLLNRARQNRGLVRGIDRQAKRRYDSKIPGNPQTALIYRQIRSGAIEGDYDSIRRGIGRFGRGGDSSDIGGYISRAYAFADKYILEPSREVILIELPFSPGRASSGRLQEEIRRQIQSERVTRSRPISRRNLSDIAEYAVKRDVRIFEVVVTATGVAYPQMVGETDQRGIIRRDAPQRVAAAARRGVTREVRKRL